MSVAVEIAVQDRAGARAAADAGADRVELCCALELGGLTPSIGLVEAVVEDNAEGFVHVLVRPRPGDFVYADEEVDVLVRSILAARSAGAAGVVLGALTEESAIDERSVKILLAAAGPLEVTFHRAVDVVARPAEAVGLLGGLGVTRVLSSGGAARAGDGVAVLGEMAAAAGDAVQVMAGGGLSPADVPRMAAAGVDAVHLSARTRVAGGPSGPGGGPALRDVTDTGLVREAVAAARAR